MRWRRRQPEPGPAPGVPEVGEKTSTGVRSIGSLALELAERLVAVVEAVVVRLTPGRTFGPTLERRLRTSIKTLTNVYERDNMIADELERGWEEEAGKRAQLQAEKGDAAS